MAAVRYTGIHHLALATRDVEATIRFWRDPLGMRRVAGLDRAGYRQYFFEVSDRDMLAFFEWPEVLPLPEKDHGVPVSGPFAFDHVSFGVENDEALWELKDLLEAAGMWVSEIVDHGFIHSLYTFDPNRIPIEFSAPTGALDLRAAPRMRDRHPARAALEGAEPQDAHRPAEVPRTPERERAVYPGEGKELIEDP